MNRHELEEKLRNLIPQKELAAILKVSIKTLIAWNTNGINGRTLPKVRIGRNVYYQPDDVDRFRQFVTGGN